MIFDPVPADAQLRAPHSRSAEQRPKNSAAREFGTAETCSRMSETAQTHCGKRTIFSENIRLTEKNYNVFLTAISFAIAVLEVGPKLLMFSCLSIAEHY